MLRPLHSTFFILFLLLVSCGKDIEQFIPHQGQAYLDQLFDEVTSPNETISFQVTGDEVKSITASGVLFIINTQSLIDDVVVNVGDTLNLSFWALTSSMDLLRHQLSTTVKSQVFESTIAIRYEIKTSEGSRVESEQSSIEVIIPTLFDDSGESTVYQSNVNEWQELESNASLSSGNFEIVVDEATIWSDFGYSLYAASDLWYALSSGTISNAESTELCVTGNLEIDNSQLYLVSDEQGVTLKVGYESLTEKFCDAWYTSNSHSTFTLYALRADDERNFYISTLNDIEISKETELDLSDSMVQIEREALITLLKG